MIEYSIHKTKFGDIEPCSSCGCEVPTFGFDWDPPFTKKHETEKRMLCEFCASSFVGNYTNTLSYAEYDVRNIAVLIAQAVNHILSKIAPSDDL